jgi:hypothetical protein
MEGEEDIISRENEVEEHEIGGKECPHSQCYGLIYPSPLSHTDRNHNRLRSRFGSHVTTPNVNVLEPQSIT